MVPDLAVNINSNYAQILKDSNHLLTSRGATYDLLNNEYGLYESEEQHVARPLPGILQAAIIGAMKMLFTISLRVEALRSCFYRKSDTIPNNIIRFVWMDAATGKL